MYREERHSTKWPKNRNSAAKWTISRNQAELLGAMRQSMATEGLDNGWAAIGLDVRCCKGPLTTLN